MKKQYFLYILLLCTLQNASLSATLLPAKKVIKEFQKAYATLLFKHLENAQPAFTNMIQLIVQRDSEGLKNLPTEDLQGFKTSYLCIPTDQYCDLTLQTQPNIFLKYWAKLGIQQRKKRTI